MTDATKYGAAAVTAAATWALAGIWVRLLPGVPLLGVVAGRLTLALPFMAVLLYLQRRRLPPGVLRAPATWGLAALMAAYYLCSVAAFQLAPVAEATLFINASPLFAVAFAPWIGQGVRRREVWGAVVAMAGVAVSAGPALAEAAGAASGARLLGDALALGAALLMAAYAAMYRHLGRRGDAPPPAAPSTLAFVLGLGLGLAWLATAPPAAASLTHPGTLGPLLALAVGSTAVPTFAFSAASRALSPVTANTFRLLTPLFAAAFAFLVLGEVPTVWLLPGGALVLGGLGLILWPAQRAHAAA